jgi:hypothetical protein
VKFYFDNGVEVIIAQHCKHLKMDATNTELFRRSKDIEVGINLSKNFRPITVQIFSIFTNIAGVRT